MVGRWSFLLGSSLCAGVMLVSGRVIVLYRPVSGEDWCLSPSRQLRNFVGNQLFAVDLYNLTSHFCVIDDKIDKSHHKPLRCLQDFLLPFLWLSIAEDESFDAGKKTLQETLGERYQARLVWIHQDTGQHWTRCGEWKYHQKRNMWKRM